jgi:hypothetical protein
MNDREFDDLLKTASAPVSLPASFNQDVWSRIESRAADDDLPVIARFQPRLTNLPGPWGAALGVAAMVALGLWLGAATVPQAKDAKHAYAESISPFATPHRK